MRCSLNYASNGAGQNRHAPHKFFAWRIATETRYLGLEWCGEREREELPQPRDYVEAAAGEFTGLNNAYSAKSSQAELTVGKTGITLSTCIIFKTPSTMPFTQASRSLPFTFFKLLNDLTICPTNALSIWSTFPISKIIRNCFFWMCASISWFTRLQSAPMCTLPLISITQMPG